MERPCPCITFISMFTVWLFHVRLHSSSLALLFSTSRFTTRTIPCSVSHPYPRQVPPPHPPQTWKPIACHPRLQIPTRANQFPPSRTNPRSQHETRKPISRIILPNPASLALNPRERRSRRIPQSFYPRGIRSTRCVRATASDTKHDRHVEWTRVFQDRATERPTDHPP